jgi:hypothetical protein
VFLLVNEAVLRGVPAFSTVETLSGGTALQPAFQRFLVERCPVEHVFSKPTRGPLQEYT